MEDRLPLGLVEREELGRNFARLVSGRCSTLGISLKETSEENGVPLAVLTGEERPSYPELRKICEVLFPDTQPHEIMASCMPGLPSRNLILRFIALWGADRQYQAP